MKFSQRFFKIISIVVISILLLLILGAKILSRYAEKTISEKLAEIHCQVDSLDVDIFSRSIRGSRLRWTSATDSAHAVPHQLTLSHISIRGIGILRYLLSHELHISTIEGEDGAITYNHALKIKAKSQQQESNLKAIYVDHLVFSKMNVHVTSDTIPEYAATIGVNLKAVRVEPGNSQDKAVHYQVAAAEALVEHLVMQGKASLYNTTISRAYLNSTDELVEFDSIQMNPLKGKYEFANSLGKQKTRVVLHIPRIRMTGFDFDALRDSIFSVSTTEIQNAHLAVFRDKRLPFKNPYIPLPMQMLEEIPFGIKLDTIRIANSVIVHEEIAEGGNETGKINLTEVTATISNFNNRLYDDRPAFSVIVASSKFMNTGLIEASFLLPIKRGANYEARGKISHLNLRELNTITEAVGFLRIESGLMNRLNFNFKYNEYKSNGVLDINYENLKMVSLNKKDKKNEINQFKTFIINALVKKDKDKDTPKAQRTGKIDIDRDRHRFVVNLWVMSLFDGLKSAVLPDTQEQSPKK